MADNDLELRSSEMFIEKESNNNLVATTNENQRYQAPCDKELRTKFQDSRTKTYAAIPI